MRDHPPYVATPGREGDYCRLALLVRRLNRLWKYMYTTFLARMDILRCSKSWFLLFQVCRRQRTGRDLWRWTCWSKHAYKVPQVPWEPPSSVLRNVEEKEPNNQTYETFSQRWGENLELHCKWISTWTGSSFNVYFEMTSLKKFVYICGVDPILKCLPSLSGSIRLWSWQWWRVGRGRAGRESFKLGGRASP